MSQDFIQKITDRFAALWKKMGLGVDLKHPYIVDPEHRHDLLHPSIREQASKLGIRFHSANNPKSSQLLALNLLLSTRSLDTQFFQRVFPFANIDRRPEVRVEWIPGKDDNILQQENVSNHDALLDFGHVKLLVEVKFTESSNQPCSSSLIGPKCRHKFSEVECPLEQAYGTRYYSILRTEASPYDSSKIEAAFKYCPFLEGDQFQFMRYVLYCHEKNKTGKGERWYPVVLYPAANSFIHAEVARTQSLLKSAHNIHTVLINDFIAGIEPFDDELYSWLSERYSG